MNASISQLLEDVPIGDMVTSLGRSLMETQLELDIMSLRAAQKMSGRYQVVSLDHEGREVTEERDTTIVFEGERLSLLDLGFVPTFYQLVEAYFEVKVSISLTRESSNEQRTSSSTSRWPSDSATTRATSVDARFASRFGFSAVGSSLMTTRLAPVPAPNRLMDTVQKAAAERSI